MMNMAFPLIELIPLPGIYRYLNDFLIHIDCNLASLHQSHSVLAQRLKRSNVLWCSDKIRLAIIVNRQFIHFS